MIGKIADLILEHVYKMQFVCEDERKSLRLDLYKDAEKLYQQDPISFARGFVRPTKVLVKNDWCFTFSILHYRHCFGRRSGLC